MGPSLAIWTWNMFNMKGKLRQTGEKKFRKRNMHSAHTHIYRYFYAVHWKWWAKCKQKSVSQNERDEWTRRKRDKKYVMIFVSQSLVIHQRYICSFPSRLFLFGTFGNSMRAFGVGISKSMMSASMVLSHVAAKIYYCSNALSPKSS